jgi:hypothetical protein
MKPFGQALDDGRNRPVYRCVLRSYRQTGRASVRGKRYYTERAAYMRTLARTAQTEALRISCLKAAEQYEALLEAVAEEAPAETREQ